MNFWQQKIHSLKENGFSSVKLTVAEGLFLNGSAYRANRSAVSAADAGISVDNVLVVALGDSAYGALLCASSALDASVSNFESHRPFLLVKVQELNSLDYYDIIYLRKCKRIFISKLLFLS